MATLGARLLKAPPAGSDVAVTSKTQLAGAIIMAKLASLKSGILLPLMHTPLGSGTICCRRHHHGQAGAGAGAPRLLGQQDRQGEAVISFAAEGAAGGDCCTES